MMNVCTDGQHCSLKAFIVFFWPFVSGELYRTQELCVKVEVVVMGFSVPNCPYGLCGRKATLNLFAIELRSIVKVEVAVLGSLVPSSPYGLCGRRAKLNFNLERYWRGQRSQEMGGRGT